MVAEQTKTPKALLREFGAEEKRLEGEHGVAAYGRVIAAARSAALDRAVRSFVGTRPPRGWAVVAVGGYGRGELSPHSDVDLLVLTRRRDAKAEETARTLFYSLWDAGLELTPSVRTIAESLSLAARDLTVQTSSLTARFLAGEPELFDEYQRRILAEARRQSGIPFLRTLLADIRGRHRVHAEAAHGLEPDLKDGRGGLRDAHSLLWAGLVIGAGGLRDLVKLGYLAPDELDAVEASTEAIMRARYHLHKVTGRRTDRLFFAHQSDVASRLGYVDVAGGPGAVEQFTRDLNTRAAAISWAADGFWERIEVDLLGSGRTRGGRQVAYFDQEVDGAGLAPDDALALFAEAARRGVCVSHRLVRRIKSAITGIEPLAYWSPGARESMFDALQSGATSDDLIEAMADSGLLGVYLPEWESIRFQTHRDVYHLHTVDRHLTLTVRNIGMLADGRCGENPLAATVAAELPSLDMLYLGGLIHDLGKGQSGDHSIIGSEIAARIAARAGLSSEATETLTFLVREHLLLVRTATRRDLDDEMVIQRVATLVQTPDRLRMLYLLTLADSLATGPGASTEWQAALVRELFFRVMGLLRGEGQQAEAPQSVLSARQAELGQALAGEAENPAVERFLAAMPAAYLLAQPASTVREHFALLSQSDDAVRVAIRHLPGSSHDELTLIAVDRPGLLWRVCGVFALHGVNVLEARAYTSARGEVLDVFRLFDVFEGGISDEKRENIVRDLSLVLDGRLSLTYRLGRKLRHYRATRSEPAIQTRVKVENNVSSEYTVVEIHARDRLGLLYAIARSMSELQLDIHLAKLMTRGPEAIDVFYVRNVHGRKVTDADHLCEMERALLYELEEFGLEGKA